jgi:hypothetical protein
VGRALSALRLLGDAERDQLFIATKAGYAPGALPPIMASQAATWKPPSYVSIPRRQSSISMLHC